MRGILFSCDKNLFKCEDEEIAWHPLMQTVCFSMGYFHGLFLLGHSVLLFILY